MAVTGTFLNGQETLVQAGTKLGPGFWVLTPFKADAGYTVLINRGFVPSDRRDHSGRLVGDIEGRTRVQGLLRITEPKGAFLRSNDPASGRWFSRDVQAIAASRALAGPVAPYFIDADGTPNPGGLPVGGLTVISFPNSHLVYAITWYSLAIMLAGGIFYVGRQEWRLRARSGGSV